MSVLDEVFKCREISMYFRRVPAGPLIPPHNFLTKKVRFFIKVCSFEELNFSGFEFLNIILKFLPMAILGHLRTERILIVFQNHIRLKNGT